LQAKKAAGCSMRGHSCRYASSAAFRIALATPELRRKVFDALAGDPRDVLTLEDGLLKIDLREPRRALAASLPIYAGFAVLWSAILKSSTAIRCSAAEGYLRLSAEMIRLAPAYAAAYPVRRGRRRLDAIAVS
jgi:hypothetical protein